MIMASLDKANKLYQQRLDQNQTAMINLNLPLEFQMKVLNSMVLQEVTLQSQVKLRDFLDKMPPSLKFKALTFKF